MRKYVVASGRNELQLELQLYPLVGGSLQGTVTLTDNSLNVTNATQTITLQGMGLKAAQTITFGAISVQTVGTPLMLMASASSNQPVSFASQTMGVCMVSGNTATFLTSGMCTIVASQVGNSTYNPAPNATQSFMVNKAAGQTIAFNALPDRPVGARQHPR